MSRSDWKKLPIQYSTATYVAFTKEQKKRFWKEKFEELKALPWNQAEINHLDKAEEFIMANPFIFSAEKMTMEEMDKLELFCYKWCKYAEKYLKWDKQVAYSILATGYTPINTKGTIDTSKVSSEKTTKGIDIGYLPNRPGTLQSCNCNLNCAMGCFPNNVLCENIPCKDDVHGCGWVLVQSCNGRCGGY